MAKPPASTLSLERTALVAAHAAKLERDGEMAAVQAAYERSCDAVHDAFGVIGQIERDLKERPEVAARRLVRAGYGDDEPEPEGTRELRQRLAHAEEDAEDAKRVRDELRKQVDAFANYNFSEGRLRSAAVAVLRAETTDIVAEALSRIEALTIELAQARAVLGTLKSLRVWGELDRDVPSKISSAIAPQSDEVWRIHSAARASCPLAAVLDALMADPHAPIPGP